MKRSASLLLTSLFLLMSGCTSLTQSVRYSLEEVARSDRQWTGIALAPDGRIFVNYPRWSDSVPISVGELLPDGTVSPYPTPEMNRWEAGLNPADHFVCVQSVVMDADGFLWILDPANPEFKGVVPGGPKLVKVDPASGRIVQTVRFSEPVIERSSYLNDVRIDTRRKVAYLTDSGAGGIVVTNLVTGTSRRLLANDPSTRSEDTIVVFEGSYWVGPDGSIPQVHADGIALDPEGRYLYYHALTGRTLYRIDTRWLLEPSIGDRHLAQKVERLGDTGAADGLEFGADGRVYLTALEQYAITTLVPGERARILVQNREIAWPDSLAFGPDGALYFTTSQIHLGPRPPSPYKIFRVMKK